MFYANGIILTPYSHSTKQYNPQIEQLGPSSSITLNQTTFKMKKKQCSFQNEFVRYTKMYPEELLVTLSDQTNNLDTYLRRNDQQNTLKLFVKCLKILSEAQFDAAKMKIFNKVFASNFTNILGDFIVSLESKVTREFYENLLDTLEVIIELSPSMAKTHLASIFKNLETALRYPDLNNMSVLQQFLDVREKFTLTLQNRVSQKTDKTCFRDFSIVPKIEDIYSKSQVLHPNIINGSYKSVEHYLSVQFHLMREDFLSSLRNDINLYRSSKFISKNSKTRFYNNTKLLYYKLQEGILLLDVRYSWNKVNKTEEDDKLFMFGSLVCLSSDKFSSILFCTVHYHNIKQGKISVIPLTNEPVTNEMFKKSYVMFECNAFFPPYFNIMKNLQKTHLAKNFPFEDYIVHVRVEKSPPKYLNNISEYKLFDGTKIKPSEIETLQWTAKSQMNESQFDAYKMALCREFVTIQGPPGTGKSFIALKIAATLLQNFYSKRNKNVLKPILVVCYKNIALDHFLEGLLPYTKNIVRIGGQSESEKLKKFNLKYLRKCPRRRQHDLKNNGRELLTMTYTLSFLDSNDHIVDLSEQVNFRFAPDVSICREFGLSVDFNQFFKNYGSGQKPAIVDWLLLDDYTLDEKRKLHVQKNCAKNTTQPANGLVLKHNNFVFTIQELEVQLDKLMKNINKSQKTVSLCTLENCKLDLQYLKMRLLRGNNGYSKINNFDSSCDPKSFKPEERWSLYWDWLKNAKAFILNQFSAAMETNKSENIIFDELRQATDLKILKEKHVIGMTTSGAARLHSLLRALRPSIVIIEEAAEVVETHVLVALIKECEHLIMIGDHQQLRPLTATYEMSKQYYLDVSLFERMVNNGTNCSQLKVQHRMRPEIASLITPSIYKLLENHHSVTCFPNIKGVAKNLFFINHVQDEKKVKGDSSKMNIHEVNFLLALARYLIRQGYLASEITILSTYSLQTLMFNQARESMPDLQGVLITNLDGYQGEENRIILLSLVRSNRKGNIGFLSTNNRVCVALSRAKEGFYIIGNMDILKKGSKLWSSIAKTLTEHGSIGPNLILCCPFHPDKLISVKHANDFSKVPNGGCGKPCKKILECGHTCPKLCHFNPSHHQEICEQNCLRKICQYNHVCPKKCYEECSEICKELILRTLGCGHRVKKECHIDHSQLKHIVTVKRPGCNHHVDLYCHEVLNHEDICSKCILISIELKKHKGR